MGILTDATGASAGLCVGSNAARSAHRSSRKSPIAEGGCLRRLAVLIAVMLLVPARVGKGQTGADDAVRRELEAMKEQLRRVQQQMKQQAEQIQRQEELIRKLTAAKAPSPAPAAVPPATPPAAVADEERIKRQVTEQIMRRIQPQLTAANRPFPSQFNPAIGVILDNVASYKEHERGNFEFRAAEIGISASVDPFARGYAIITGSSSGFDVEEAAIVTTSLPYNLTVKGGRFFADFGRLSQVHDHDLPFVNRPLALDNFMQGEARADGVEVGYLVPWRQYVHLSVGAYDKIGAGNDRVDPTVPRDLSKFTYLGRGTTFLSLTDANSVDLGGSWAYTPEVAKDNGASRTLAGVDLTYRYIPLGQAAYRGLVWGTELLYNQEDRPIGGFPAGAAASTLFAPGLADVLPTHPASSLAVSAAAKPLVFRRRGAVGLYSYIEARLSRRFTTGFLFDYAEDIDHVTGATEDYSPYLTMWLSEFQRLRFQYTRLQAPGDHENQFFLQWTVVLGSHVHGFRER
jgi:hypothetical protein